jgi:hypothetical protein
MIMAILRAERPMLRLPAGIGPTPGATPQPAPAAPAAESSLNEVPATGGQTHIWLKADARSMSRAHAAALRGAAGKPARKRHDLDHQRDARPRDGDDKQHAHGG